MIGKLTFTLQDHKFEVGSFKLLVGKFAFVFDDKNVWIG
jgi:hypothetical protein